MDGRYRETESNSVRDELAVYQYPACQSCGGSRLREEARNVFLGDINLPQLTTWSIGEAWTTSRKSSLAAESADRREDFKIRDRLGFLVNVGPQLFEPITLSGNPLGR